MIDIEKLKEIAIEILSSIYDPEIPVNIYDLGLIYQLNIEQIEDKNVVHILMTLTNPNCPAAESLANEVVTKLSYSSCFDEVKFQLTFDPPWNPEQLSDEIKLELGIL